VIMILRAGRLSEEGFHGMKITGEARKSDEIVQPRSLDWAASFPMDPIKEPLVLLIYAHSHLCSWKDLLQACHMTYPGGRRPGVHGKHTH